MSKSLTTPVEIDTALAALYNVASAAESRRANYVHYVIDTSAPEYRYVGRQRVTTRTFSEARTILETAIAAHEAAGKPGPLDIPGSRSFVTVERVKDYFAEIEKQDAIIAKVEADMEPLNAAYEDKETGRWSRFFLVTSSAGHIHSSMRCSTCRPTTTYGWLPILSGSTETEAVAAYGPALCSVCFPSAPVDMVGGKISQSDAEKAAADALEGKPAPTFETPESRRAAKQAEREAKQAAKDEKARLRASKLVDKVEAAIKALTGKDETAAAIQAFRAEWSDYGHEGLKAVYGISWQDEYKALKINTTTEDLLSFIVTKDKWNKPNGAVQAELRERGLTA